MAYSPEISPTEPEFYSETFRYYIMQYNNVYNMDMAVKGEKICI